MALISFVMWWCILLVCNDPILTLLNWIDCCNDLLWSFRAEISVDAAEVFCRGTYSKRRETPKKTAQKGKDARIQSMDGFLCGKHMLQKSGWLTVSVTLLQSLSPLSPLSGLNVKAIRFGCIRMCVMDEHLLGFWCIYWNCFKSKWLGSYFCGICNNFDRKIVTVFFLLSECWWIGVSGWRMYSWYSSERTETFGERKSKE